MEESKTVAQRALDLLIEVPENQWIKGSFSDRVSKCCAVGHIARLTSANPDDFHYDNCSPRYRSLSREVERLFHPQKKCGIIDVNDGAGCGYKEKSPKARVIHFLRDCIKTGL